MEQIKTNLHIAFVGADRRIIREVNTKCMLSKDEDMPRIFITDNMILDLLDAWDLMPMPFYDTKKDKFNFNTQNIHDLDKNNDNIPNEIVLEILEVQDQASGAVTYTHLGPGLWKEDDEGRYRMCDDSILHIIMDTKVLPLVNDNSISFDDGAAMTLFYFMHHNLVLDVNLKVEDSEDTISNIDCDNCDCPKVSKVLKDTDDDDKKQCITKRIKHRKISKG